MAVSGSHNDKVGSQLPLLRRTIRDANIVSTEPKDQTLASLGNTMEQQLTPLQLQINDQEAKGYCLFNGSSVPEESVQCETQPGCRAIQKTGYCCPDYKCDCEKDGKVYLKGEKLVDLENPCTVCYCKGGEIICSNVTCFHRDDCMPKYIPGRCCPEYDNCPIASTARPISELSTPRVEAPLVPVLPLNFNITIKEITKPTEIRITDDNWPKAPQIRKPISTTTATTTTSAPTTATTTATPTVVESTTAGLLASPTTPHSASALETLANTNTNETVAEKAVLSVQESLKPATTVEPAKLDLSLASADSSWTTAAPAEPAAVVSVVSAHIAEPIVEPEVASSEHIYRVISSTGGPSSDSSISSTASEVYLLDKDADIYANETSTSVVELNTQTESAQPLSSTQTEEATSESSPASAATISAGVSSVAPIIHHADVDDDITPIDTNPAYPSLPEDDFSLRDVNFPLAEPEDEAKDEQRSIQGKRKEQLTGSGDGVAGRLASSTPSSSAIENSAAQPAPLILSSAEISSVELGARNAISLAARVAAADDSAAEELGSGSDEHLSNTTPSKIHEDELTQSGDGAL